MVRLLPTGRAVVAYRGALLPGYVHTIRIEHLRPIPGEKYRPFKIDPTKTHHLWILASPMATGGVQIIASLQMAIVVPTGDGFTMDLWQAPDRIATQIGKFLGEIIAPDIVTGLKDPRLLRRIPDKKVEADFTPFRESFWAQAVDAKFKDARKEYR